MSMLQPVVADLLKMIPNRYLVVNVAAQRARCISKASEDTGIPLKEKPVSTALRQIAAGQVHLEDAVDAPVPDLPEHDVHSESFAFDEEDEENEDIISGENNTDTEETEAE